MPLGVSTAKNPCPSTAQIQGIPGLLQLALGQVELVAAQEAEVVHGASQLRIEGVRTQKHRTEVLPLRPVAGGLRIGEIGSGRIQGLGSRHQARHRGIVSTVHKVPSCTWVPCR